MKCILYSVLLLAVMGIACVLCRVFTHNAAMKKQDAGNMSFVYMVLADEIQRKNIRIYTALPQQAVSYSVEDFKIHLVPLRHDRENTEFQIWNITRHNHQSVAMFACHIWDEKPLLAKTLMKTLYDVNPDARAVVDDYRDHGYLTASRGMVLLPQEAKWRWFDGEFMQYRKTHVQGLDGPVPQTTKNPKSSMNPGKAER